MPTFEVVSVDHEIKPWRTKDGQRAFIDYSIHVDGPGGRGGPLLLTRLPSSDAPVPGDTLEGFEILHENGRAKLKKEKQGQGFQERSGGPNGGFQRDPKDTAQIVRQHSQTTAVYWLAVLQKAGNLPDPSEAILKATIDWFDRDVQNNAGTA